MLLATNPFPANGSFFTVTPDTNGIIAELGQGGQRATGLVVIQWVPGPDFVGSLMVMGRIAGVAQAITDQVAMAPIPYRRLNVNGAGSDYAMTLAAITGPGIIQIPASGLSVGLLVSCTQGRGRWYMQALNGSSAP